MNYIGKINSPVGRLTVSSDGRALTGLWLEGQKYFGSTLGNAGEVGDATSLPVFGKVRRWLDAYFAGKNPRVDFPLKPEGSDFRQKVWEILRGIPYGELTTYGAIAKQIAKADGKKSFSAQAVGGAVGHNPISIIIPCHRVVGADGSLTGYAGGTGVKAKLLELEGSAACRRAGC